MRLSILCFVALLMASCNPSYDPYTWQFGGGTAQLIGSEMIIVQEGKSQNISVQKIRDGQFEGMSFRFLIDKQGHLHAFKGKDKRFTATPDPNSPLLKSSAIARSILGPAAYFKNTQEARECAARAKRAFERVQNPWIANQWYDIQNDRTYSLILKTGQSQGLMLVHQQNLSPEREEPITQSPNKDRYVGTTHVYRLVAGDLVMTSKDNPQGTRLLRKENLNWFD